MKRILLAIILLFSSCVPFSCGPAIDAKKEIYNDTATSMSAGASGAITTDKLKIVIFDIGQGDATLVVAPNGNAALIDTGVVGSGNNKISPYLAQNSEINLKHLLISHKDNDHDGAAAEITLEPEEVKPGDKIDIGDGATILVLAGDCALSNGQAIQCEAEDDNAHSEALLITYGLFKYLTTGDLPGGGGNPPYETIDIESSVSPLAGDVDILHAGHHGSNTSTNQNLLDVTKPEAVIISVGDNNDYWHPHPSTVERLINAGIKIYQTERGWLKDEFMDDVCIANGDIVIEVGDDGYTINCP